MVDSNFDDILRLQRKSQRKFNDEEEGKEKMKERKLPLFSNFFSSSFFFLLNEYSSHKGRLNLFHSLTIPAAAITPSKNKIRKKKKKEILPIPQESEHLMRS